MKQNYADPVMRIHGCRQPGETIINKAGEVREWTGADNEVWSFGEEATLPIFLRNGKQNYLIGEV